MSASATIEIRLASTDDATKLAETISLAYRDVARRFGITSQNAPSHPSNAEPHWVLSDLNSGSSYLMALVNESCVGCVAFKQTGTELEAQRLAVVPSHRGGNVARLLNEAVLHAARLGGAQTIRIAIVADHQSLRRWYERMGFRHLEVRTFDHLPFKVQYLELNILESVDVSGCAAWPAAQ